MPKVRFGLSNVHFAKRHEDEENGVYYDTPEAYKGAVKLSLSRSTDKNDFFADNIVYYTSFNKSEREGELEMALITDFIKENYLGYMKDVNGHLVETNQQGDSFALLFQVETDETNKKYCVFNCVATENDSEFETIEGASEPQTQTLNLSMAGEGVGDVQVFAMEVDSFDSVELPVFASI